MIQWSKHYCICSWFGFVTALAFTPGLLRMIYGPFADSVDQDHTAQCYVHTQLFLALYMCLFIFGFP